MSTLRIRPETDADLAAIREIVCSAFANHLHSQQTEHRIVDALREHGALTLSLVAERDGTPVGHVAFSPVSIDGHVNGWYGLGPVAVLPAAQGCGIGRALIEAGLSELRSRGAAGCVVVGEPAYYQRFGFHAQPDLTLPGLPPEYFMALTFGATTPAGTVAYHAAFSGRPLERA